MFSRVGERSQGARSELSFLRLEVVLKRCIRAITWRKRSFQLLDVISVVHKRSLVGRLSS